MTENIPNPGSIEAIKQGCRCPVIDNSYGKGAYEDKDGKPLFWRVEDCPIHGYEAERKKK